MLAGVDDIDGVDGGVCNALDDFKPFGDVDAENGDGILYLENICLQSN